jgi:hypothetical protein
MSAPILAAVLTLRESLPAEVDSLVSHFVISKKDLTSAHYRELYFLMDHTKDKNVQRVISQAVNDLRY